MLSRCPFEGHVTDASTPSPSVRPSSNVLDPDPTAHENPLISCRIRRQVGSRGPVPVRPRPCPSPRRRNVPRQLPPRVRVQDLPHPAVPASPRPPGLRRSSRCVSSPSRTCVRVRSSLTWRAVSFLFWSACYGVERCRVCRDNERTRREGLRRLPVGLLECDRDRLTIHLNSLCDGCAGPGAASGAPGADFRLASWTADEVSGDARSLVLRVCDGFEVGSVRMGFSGFEVRCRMG